MQLTVPDQLHSFMPMALIRLNYLYPDLTFSFENNDVVIRNCPVDRETLVKRDVLYTLYREKIYAETLSMRKSLFEAAMRT